MTFDEAIARAAENDNTRAEWAAVAQAIALHEAAVALAGLADKAGFNWGRG